MRVLVTGAGGFVGTALVERLATDAHVVVRAAVRRGGAALPPAVERVSGELAPEADWRASLEGVDALVHLAARVHVMHETATDPLAEFRRVNVDGTLNLARQAADAGVRRLVYLSSVKVHGEAGAFTEEDTPAPKDAYGTSKHESEGGLRRVATETGLEVVILRPPLVYGPGVRANFRALATAVRRGMPLPLGAIRNRRSLIALDNLLDVIAIGLTHPAAANETFLVSDGDDLSTPELVRRLARALGRPARLLPVPPALLVRAAALVGRRDAATRLVGSLTVDIAKVRARLGWSPRVSVDEALARTVAAL